MERLKVDRLLVALAMLKPTPSEVVELRRKITSVSTTTLISILRSLYRDATGVGALEVLSDEPYPLVDRSGAEIIYQQIRPLLQRERLPRHVVAERVVRELVRGRPGQKIPRFNSKKGLSHWISALTEKFSASEIYAAFAASLDSEARANWSWPLK